MLLDLPIRAGNGGLIEGERNLSQAFRPSYQGWKLTDTGVGATLKLLLDLPIRAGNSDSSDRRDGRRRAFRPSYQGWKLRYAEEHTPITVPF